MTFGTISSTLAIAQILGASAAGHAKGGEKWNEQRVFVPSFVPHPGYEGPLKVAGSVTISQQTWEETPEHTYPRQTLTWDLMGVDPECTTGASEGITNGCGIEVYEGGNCVDQVGDHHYFLDDADKNNPDPWLPVKYVASEGASISATGFDVTSGVLFHDLIGKVVVVHDKSGGRVACGVVGEETGVGMGAGVATFETYPQYAGDLKVKGSVVITGINGNDETAGQSLTWSLAGLDPTCNTIGAGESVTNGCGIHIHEGTSCETTSKVGGHFFSKALNAADPWANVRYVAPSRGVSQQTQTVNVTTGLAMGDIIGRTVVVYEMNGGGRIACGVILPQQPLSLFENMFNKYPGYTGDLAPIGTVKVLPSSNNVAGTQNFTWTFYSGLDSACTEGAGDFITEGCGIHVHEGTSCSTDVDSNYYNKDILSDDPWLAVKYVVGAGRPDGSVQVNTGFALSDLDGHVVVVHAKDGSQVACGKVTVEEFHEEEVSELNEMFPTLQESRHPRLSTFLVLTIAATGLVALLFAARAYRTPWGEAVPSDEESGTPVGSSSE